MLAAVTLTSASNTLFHNKLGGKYNMTECCWKLIKYVTHKETKRSHYFKYILYLREILPPKTCHNLLGFDFFVQLSGR